MQKPSPPFPHISITTRSSHSHLDSATYRSLVRLLSLCADEPLVSHPPAPPSGSNPTSTGGNRLGGLQGNLIRCRANTVRDGTRDDQEEELGIEDVLERGGGYGELSKDKDANFLSAEELRHVISHSPKGLGRFCPGSAGANAEDAVLVGELGDGKGQEELNERVCGNPRLVFDSPDEVFHLFGESDQKGRQGDGGCGSSGHQGDPMLEDVKVLDSAMTDFAPQGKIHERSDGSVSRELTQEVVFEDSKSFCALPKNFGSADDLGSTQEENCGSSTPSAAVSGLENKGEDPTTNYIGLITSGEMEEGEISGDEREMLSEGEFCNEEEIPNEEQVTNLPGIEEKVLEKRLQPDHLDEKRDTADISGSFISGMVEETIINNVYEFDISVYGQTDKLNRTYLDDKMLKPQQKEKGGNSTKNNAKPEKLASDNLNLAGETTLNSASQDEGKLVDVKEDKFRERRKRGSLTEERKEKKKQAKKCKRAETNRKLGIKRLKLPQISMPKKVVYCKHFLKGRCNKGDSCPFSHDTTPLTKSEPCKFFACHSCLKGDDCPFDHQLSKYPCHNYMSKGICSRGNTCMFSHEKPTVGGSSLMSLVGKTDSPAPSEKHSLLKHLNGQNSSSALNNSQKITAFGSSTHDVSMENWVEMKPKAPTMVPKGICFISFGKEASNGTAKRQPNLSLKKGNNVQMPDLKSKNVKGDHSKPPVFNIIASKESNAGSLSSGSAAMPSSWGLESDVASATKILEEFLFGDGL